MDDGHHVDVLRQGLAALEFIDLDDEVDHELLRVEIPLHHPGDCGNRAACGEQVVVHQHYIVRRDGVLVDLDRVGTVLFHVGLAVGIGGQFAGLARHHEAGAQAGSQGGADHETARLHAHHFGDAFVFVDLVEVVDEFAEAVRIFEKGGDIPEEDALDGEVRNGPEAGFKFFYTHRERTTYEDTIFLRDIRYLCLEILIMQKRSGKGRKPSGKKHSGGGKKVFPQYVGKVQMTREGFIFVIVEGQDDDIFVKAPKTRHALQGDTVRVAVTREKFGDIRRREGEVVEILERSTRPFVGYYHAVGAQAWVLMQSKSMPYDIQVDARAAAAMGAQAGMKVAAVVDRWDRRDPGPFGHVVDVLGMPGENETEMHAILAEFNLPYRFSEEVEHAADKISDEITAEDLKGRKDFRDTFTLTIDPADAKDFDDALSFRPLENGNFEIGVHIADVSYYVKPGSPVDKEARDRGTSVYLVDRTVPMLPEKLCNKLCSLRPHEDKLTFSAVFEMTPKAEIRSRWIGRTVINSDYRLDYEQAQSIIEGASGSGQLPPETSCSAGPLPSDDGPLPLTMPRVARFPEAVPAAVPQEVAESLLENVLCELKFCRGELPPREAKTIFSAARAAL